jgi:hypothetical protein
MSTINKHIMLIFVSIFAFWNVAFCEDGQQPNITDFYQALQQGPDDQAVLVGQKIFEQIERKYRADAGFGALKSKMTAADFLANQMVAQLKKATSRQMSAIAENLFADKTKSKKWNPFSVTPAKSFYETSLEIFSKPASISKLEEEEKKFLVSFYDLKLRVLTSEIAKAGQALAIAEPDFKGTYDYVLVLPLLHASETRPVNIEVLPRWMRQSDQLEVFSDSCLLHYGLAYHAQVFAKEAAELSKKEFVQAQFYQTASKKCAGQFPRIAVDCLKRSIDSIAEEKIDERMNLQFDIIQIWLDSGNFTLAAGEAKKTADALGDNKRSGNAIWLYFYALSRANSVDIILANIDAAICDARCSEYRAKLMYVKWWALRRLRNQEAQIAALELKLLTEYKDSEMIAPIMLSRATDRLAEQDYAEALALLEQLQEKFPSTAAAGQAKKIAEKLKNMQGPKI